jgi:hypothetical protein
MTVSRTLKKTNLSRRTQAKRQEASDMAKNKGGRPKIEIDFETVDKLCEMHCSGVEIAGFLEIDYKTLNARVKEQLKQDGTTYAGFPEYRDAKSARGRISLRKMQWAAANRGNVPMQIFLGKNYLSQTEKQRIDMPDETIIKVSLRDTVAEEEQDEA